MKSFTFIILPLFVAILVTGCGITKRGTDLSKPELPVSEEAPLIEEGIASWYGPNFDGKLTATGEIYDMNGITAAHRTLPFESILLVENLENGKTVQVRINDRGPYAKDRIIDLSKGAAEKIDMIGPGTAPVKLYLLKGDLENSRITDIKVPTYTVQLGSYQDRSEAEKHMDRVGGSRIEIIENGAQTFYRVYFGTYTDPAKAKVQMEQLKDQGFDGFVKQIEN
ncbi:septal ring lytic transglycosylase RlpA family protein [Gracilimonas sp.]|uniref:septal ring lytic transglycosylase RlpA family protein n=1 Tax=Gracilimonas sp. TaxID=1974203 RepID=UPI0028715510|nr:septal ring lytic transglycosylase RlpA family protein [Gracilimonas sp.]